MVMVFLKDLIGTPSSQLEEFLRENAYKESRMEAYTEELVVIDKKLEQIAPKINNLLNALAEL
jgi:aminoglycoside phosphotransferase (APT) family kinase protein